MLWLGQLAERLSVEGSEFESYTPPMNLGHLLRDVLRILGKSICGITLTIHRSWIFPSPVVINVIYHIGYSMNHTVIYQMIFDTCLF